MSVLTVAIAGLAPGARILAPVGINSPHGAIEGAAVQGGRIIRVATDPALGLAALEIEAEGGALQLTHGVGGPGAYPCAAFVPHANRFTTPAPDLAVASRRIAADAGGGAAGIAALVAEAEARFTYAHPDRRFNDGADAVPFLSCGTTPGSCVDINTYLMAGLRAAGFEAAYIFGYFFPEERGGMTDDSHCWVVTRHGGETLEWDIAHHIKAGLGPTRPGANPRLGVRVALGHSMGHLYSGAPGLRKLLAEPALVTDIDGALAVEARVS
jgi:hypothetical protein